MDFVYLNHQIISKADASIPVDDRGFRFGDGIFETIRVAQGKAYQWEYHLARLIKGLETLRIPFDTSHLQETCQGLVKKNQLTHGFLRIAISRGVGSIGYLPTTTTPTLVIETLPMGDAPTAPVKLWLSSYRKPSPDALPVHIKTMQGLNPTLARLEAQDHQCFEALQLGQEGQLCEASSSNLFWVKDKTLFTPAEEAGILPGSIRNAIIRLSPLPVVQGIFTLDALEEAEEVFLTNVAWLALPVASLEPQGYDWHSYAVAEQFNGLLHSDINAHGD